MLDIKRQSLYNITNIFGNQYLVFCDAVDYTQGLTNARHMLYH